MALLINWKIAYQLANKLSELISEITVLFTDGTTAYFNNLSPTVDSDPGNKYFYVEYTLNLSLSQSKTIDWIQYYGFPNHEIRRTEVGLTLPAGNVVLKLRLCIPFQLED